jgi:hypothetical protein
MSSEIDPEVGGSTRQIGKKGCTLRLRGRRSSVIHHALRKASGRATPKLKLDEALVLQHNLIWGLSVAQLSQLLQLRLGQSCDNKT